jgi:hypothetical protein
VNLEELIRNLIDNQVKRSYFRLCTIDTEDGTKPEIEIRQPDGTSVLFVIDGDTAKQYKWEFSE